MRTTIKTKGLCSIVIYPVSSPPRRSLGCLEILYDHTEMIYKKRQETVLVLTAIKN